MSCSMSYNVVYIRHNVKVLCARAYSTTKYCNRSLSSEFVYHKDRRSPYATIQGVQTPSVSLSPGSVKSRSNTARSWEKGCVYGKACRELGSAGTGVRRKNREIIKRPNSRSFGSLSQKRRRAWLRSIAQRRSNCTIVLIVWRLKSFFMYIRFWFRMREKSEPKEALSWHS